MRSETETRIEENKNTGKEGSLVTPEGEARTRYGHRTVELNFDPKPAAV